MKHIRTPTVVVCPDKFWRAGHVKALCARHYMPLTPNIQGVLRFFDNVDK